MISKINSNDYSRINELGTLLNNNFSTLFHIENLNKNEYIYKYEVNNNIIGFIHIYDNIDYIEILNIIVDNNNRQKHIGSLLLNYIKDIFKKRELLEVNVNNEIAHKFYKKNGFNTINIRKNYYGNEDAEVMERI